MNNDQLFLENLTDFRDLRSISRKQDQNNYYSKTSSIASSSQQGHHNQSPELELQLQNNDKIIKNFKQLRQQLKESNQKCQKLNSKLLQKQAQIQRYKLSQKNHVTDLYNKKNQLQHLKTQNNDYKQKFQHYQQLNQSSKQQKQQLDYLKMLTYQLKNKLQKSELENKKIMELSISDKIQLQQKVKRYQAKKSSDLEYVQEMQIQTSKLREKNIKLENQLKKAQIRYDQQLYNKKWLNGNFQKQHLQQQMQQLSKQNTEITNKLKKQKQKRTVLQKKMLQLEQLTGLWTVKAQTYQIQNKNYQKKFKKIQKKMAHTKQNADIQMQQALNWQQKFLKSLTISEQLISRVKREMYGDMVSLAKSCEFKLNKLKEQKQIKQPQSKQTRKSPSISKLRSKSNKFLKDYAQTISPIRKINKQSDTKIQTDTKKYQQNISEHTKRQLFNKTDNTVFNRACTKNDDETSQSSGNKQNTQTVFAHVQNIDTKIRKERQEMEKRIREKLLYRKIEFSATSPQKQRLREDYFRLIDR